MTQKEKLKQVITEKNLSKEDKVFWESFIDKAPEILISNIIDVLSEFPNELSWLTQIYKRKQKVFTLMRDNQESGQKLLTEIYREEQKKLKELSINK